MNDGLNNEKNINNSNDIPKEHSSMKKRKIKNEYRALYQND